MENKCITNIKNEKFNVAAVKKDIDEEDECMFIDVSQVLEVSISNEKVNKKEKMDNSDDYYVPPFLKMEPERTTNNSDVLSGWVIENGNYVNKISEVELRPIKNQQTNKKSTPESALNANQNTNTSEKPYQCPICGNGFTRKDHLRRHEQGHTGVTPFECSDCGKSFNRKDRLTRHLLIHTRVYPFQCDICNKIFSRKDHMVTHRRSHDQEKAFLCNFCNKTFSRKDHLVQHKKSHLQNS